MAGFQPKPGSYPAQAQSHEHRANQYRHVLRRIAEGLETNPQLAAQVALGIRPVGALLAKPKEEWRGH